MDELDVLEENCDVIYPNSFCAFAPGAVDPVKSMLKLFRPEVEEHIKLKRCPMESLTPCPSPGRRGVKEGCIK